MYDKDEEGVAHAAQAMAERVRYLKMLEEELAKPELDLKWTSIRWRQAWIPLDTVVGLPAKYMNWRGARVDFTLTDADIVRTDGWLGFRPRCAALAAYYNARVSADHPAACLEFACDPAAPSKGPRWTVAKPDTTLTPALR